MRIRILYRSDSEWNPWGATLLSVVVHALSLLVIVTVVSALRPEPASWFHAGQTVQYISLKSQPGTLFWTPSGSAAPARPETPPKKTATLPTPVSHGEARAADDRLRPGGPASGPELPFTPEPPRFLELLPPTPVSELRVVHPADRRYPVVLSRNTAPDGAPESFHGRTVYTVYLDVGTRSQWLLHYTGAVPAVEVSGNVIRIGALESIEAPYPQVTVVPPGGSGSVRLLVSGILDSEGRFRSLRPAGPAGEAVDLLMALLERWSFRPARKRGVATAVAILLERPSENNY